MSDKWILVNGEPVLEPDLIKWAKWYETRDRVLAQTNTKTGMMVSTVFLGLDHSFGAGEPILWETLVFKGDEHPEYDQSTRWRDVDGRRYASRDAALKGHEEFVEKHGGRKDADD